MHPFWSTLAVFSFCAMTTAVAEAQNLEELAAKVGVKILAEASSSKQMLTFTKQRMPYSRMSPGARQRTNQILSNLSQYRRMPSLQYPVDPNIYQYLINHPDVAVSTWRAMGISKLEMSQVADFEFIAKATDGSNGEADVLWRDGNQCLFVVEGRYSSPILPNPIEASALVWLQYRFIKDKAGQYLVNQQVETFIYFPSVAIDTIAKMATRLTNSILDRNVFEVSLYARMMSQAAEKDPLWIQQVADRMDGVPPQRKTELVRVSRGLRPDQGPLHSINQPTAQMPEIRSSGQFKSFKDSLNEVSVHVPLLAAVPVAPDESLEVDAAIAESANSVNLPTNLHSRPAAAVSGLMDTPQTPKLPNEPAAPVQVAKAREFSAGTPAASRPVATNPSSAAAGQRTSARGRLRVKSVSVSRTKPPFGEPVPVPPAPAE